MLLHWPPPNRGREGYSSSSRDCWTIPISFLFLPPPMYTIWEPFYQKQRKTMQQSPLQWLIPLQAQMQVKNLQRISRRLRRELIWVIILALWNPKMGLLWFHFFQMSSWRYPNAFKGRHPCHPTNLAKTCSPEWMSHQKWTRRLSWSALSNQLHPTAKKCWWI